MKILFGIPDHPEIIFEHIHDGGDVRVAGWGGCLLPVN
jgi:hypothetical protein